MDLKPRRAGRHLGPPPPNRLGVGNAVVRMLKYRGAYVDYWTGVHAASGAILALSAVSLSLSFLGGFIATFALMVLWELFEPAVYKLLHATVTDEVPYHFPEKRTNQFVDVAAGLAGYVLGCAVFAPGILWIALADLLDFLAS